ncbi:hypothetical protein GHO29_10705 [Pseudomonas helleri]|uniref:Uncharacterized protein n=1 Tax=Pseudomonas helleri TaxID=1608996 RepID=A0A7X1XYC3_9PSED|nr:hypothetical protein [Pseudomonas helleri]
MGLTKSQPPKPARRASHSSPFLEPATDWKSCLRRTEDNILRAELTNAYLILKHAPEWQGVLAFNEFSSRIEKLKEPWFSAARWVVAGCRCEQNSGVVADGLEFAPAKQSGG